MASPFTFLAQRMRSWFTPRKPRTIQHRSRLMVERLEDRLAPATLHWQGDIDGLWSNAGNWLEAAGPASGDVLVFDNTTAGFNTTPGGTGFQSINDVALTNVRLSLANTSASDGFDLSGNSLTVMNFNPFIEYQGSGAGGARIRLAGLTLSGSSGISTYNTGSSLVIESPIDNAGYSLNATVQSFSQALFLSGAISGNGGFNTGSGGVVVLNGANTFTGTVSHLAGTIRLAGGQALSDLTSVDLASGSATLDVTASETVGSVSGPGKIVLGASLTTGGNNASTTHSGQISGAGGLVKQGTGTFTLSGANSFAGTTTVSQGVLNIQNNSALGTTAAGTTVLAGGALEMQGGITVTGETLILNGSGISGGGALRSLPGTGTSTFNTWSGPITLGSAATIANAGTSAFLTLGAIDTGSNALTFNQLSSEITAGGVISGAGAVIKIGSGQLRLQATNTYSGLTDIQQGVIIVSGSGTLGNTTGSTSVASGTSLWFSTVTSAEPITLAGQLQGSSAATHTGAITLAAAASIYSYDTFTVSGIVSGPWNLTKAGAGILIVTGANTYSGTTTVSQGILDILNNAALGSTAAGTIVALGGTVSVNTAGVISEPLTLQRGATLRNLQPNGTWAGGIILASDATPGASILDILGSGAMLTITGVISGTSNLTKLGNGTLVLSAANTYAGETHISAGKLRVNGTLAASANAVFVNSGATLGGSGTISRPVVINSGGTLAPGTSPGILSTDNVSLTSSSTFRVELNGATVGSGHDQLNVTGTVSLGGSTLSAVLGFSPPTGSTFVIVNNDDADAISGTFAGLAEGASLTLGGQTFQISYVGGTGNDVVLTVVPRIATWDGGGADNNWSTAANWVGDIAPANGDDLVFDTATPGVARFTNTNDFTGLTLGSIAIHDGSTTNNFTLDGNSLTLSNGITSDGSFNTSTVFFTITLAAAQTITGSGIYLSVQNINTNGFTLTIMGDAQKNLSGVISGSGGLILAGSGNQSTFLQAPNTYSGLTQITSGIAVLQGLGTLGDTTNGTIVSGGSSLGLYGAVSNSDSVTLTGSSPRLLGRSGAVQTGTVTLSSVDRTLIQVDFGALTITGNIIGNAGPTGLEVNNSGGPNAGALTLSGTNTFAGATTIFKGSMFVDGSITSGALVTVRSGATLGGSGTISGPVVVNGGGTLSPGTSPGILNSGSVSLISTSIFSAELNGATVGSGYDQLNVTGTVSLGGSTLFAVLGFSPSIGSSFVIVNNDGTDAVTGTFAGLAEGASLTLAGQSFQISYVGGTGNDVVLTRATVAAPFEITSPLEGSAFFLGENVTVQWTGGDPSGLVNLYLIERTTGLPFQVAAGVGGIPNTGSYIFTLPTTHPLGGPDVHTYDFYIENVERTSWNYGPTFTVTRANQPPTANAGGPSAVSEGGSVQLNGSGSSDPNQASTTLTYQWDLDGDTVFGEVGAAASRGDETGMTPTFSAVGLDGPSSVTVALRVTDNGSLTSTDTAVINVNNADPTATANSYTMNQGSAVAGNVMTDGIADSDPAGAADPLTVIGYTQPANGSVIVAADGSFTYTPATTFSGTDSFSYTISDGDGGTATATVTIVVNALAGGSITSVVDTCLGGTALLINGTSGNDTILVEPGSTGATLNVTINGVLSTVAKPSGRIIVTGGDGDDNIQIAGAIANSVWLYGEAGNDRLNAGNVNPGGNLLFGGDGNDDLTGGSGRDIMIGGQGADKLVGNASDDILIAGLTNYDNRSSAGHEDFWCRVMQEWTDPNIAFLTRVANLRNGTGATGASLLTNVLDDYLIDQIDMLQGSSGNDWFIFTAGEDKVVGQTEASN